MGYVYRTEKIARLLGLNETVLRLERQFGPPHDYPHKMVETVRKQLPTSRAVYKLECLVRPPHGDVLRAAGAIVLRIPVRNALFAELTRVDDERAPSTGVVYFGVDDGVTQTNRLSPNLYVPFEKVDVRVGDRWLTLTPRLLVAMARGERRAPVARSAGTPLIGHAA